MRPGIRKGARFLNSAESMFLWEEFILRLEFRYLMEKSF